MIYYRRDKGPYSDPKAALTGEEYDATLAHLQDQIQNLEAQLTDVLARLAVLETEEVDEPFSDGTRWSDGTGWAEAA